MNGYIILFFKILLSILILFLVIKIIIAKIRVKSATFEPNNVPSPTEGTPFMAELIAINVSGSMDITATIINPTTYFDNLKLSATLIAYLVAMVAPFINRKRDTASIIKFDIIYID